MYRFWGKSTLDVYFLVAIPVAITVANTTEQLKLLENCNDVQVFYFRLHELGAEIHIHAMSIRWVVAVN